MEVELFLIPAAITAIEKAIVKFLQRHYPNKVAKEQPSTKQALIIDNGHDHQWSHLFGLSTALAMMYLTFQVLASENLSQMLLQYFAISAPYFVAVYATLLDIVSFDTMRRTNALATALEQKGFQVSIIRKFDKNTDRAVNLLKDNATDGTTNIFWYFGHGGMYSKKSLFDWAFNKIVHLNEKMLSFASNFEKRLLERNMFSFLDRGLVPDTELISKLSDVPGDKIVVVDVCEAGGFVSAAASLPQEKRGRMIVATPSDTKAASKINPLVTDFIAFAKANRNSGRPVSEFFEGHANLYKKKVGWFKERCSTPHPHRPQVFVGSKTIRL